MTNAQLQSPHFEEACRCNTRWQSIGREPKWPGFNQIKMGRVVKMHPAQRRSLPPAASGMRLQECSVTTMSRPTANGWDCRWSLRMSIFSKFSSPPGLESRLVRKSLCRPSVVKRQSSDRAAHQVAQLKDLHLLRHQQNHAHECNHREEQNG